jgi:hypothetical protein
VSRIDDLFGSPNHMPYSYRFCPKGVELCLQEIWRQAAANSKHSGVWTTRVSGFATATQQIVSKLDSYGLRPESKAMRVLDPASG